MKTAPLSCPKCGEEKGWVCSDQPDTPWFKDPKMTVFDYDIDFSIIHFIIIAIRGVGFTIYKAFVHAKPIHYHCGKCGFSGRYKQD